MVKFAIVKMYLIFLVIVVHGNFHLPNVDWATAVPHDEAIRICKPRGYNNDPFELIPYVQTRA